MAHAADALFRIALLLAVGAGCLLYSAFPTEGVFPAKLLLFIGLSVVASFICGLLISGVFDNRWYRLAETLFL
jgi:hypothetical protein